MAKKATLVFSTLALLLVVFGAYYLYLSERESYFIDRNFRLLALWSKKISETVEEYKYHFQYMISEFSGSEYESRQCDNKFHENKDCDCKKSSCKTFETKFEEKFEKELAKKFEGKLIAVSACPKSKRLEHNNFVNDQPRITAQLSSKDEDLLSLTYEKESQEYERRCIDTVKVDLSISKITSRLITDQAFDDAVITEEVFSDVIIFDLKTGKVHFHANHAQAKHTLFRIDDFRDIVAQRPDTGEFFSFFSSNSKPADVRNGKPDSATPPPLKDLLQIPIHRQITIGDISYELFAQPVVLPGLTLKEQTNYRHKKDGSARLILAGLVKTDKFQSEYRTIPHTWLLLFLFFVLLGLLSLPIIHLAFMDHHEPLRPITVLSLLVTCVFGTALITLFFLDVIWLNNVRTKLDDQLEETAENIKDMFKDDLEKTRDRLREYDHSVTLMRDFTCIAQDENCPFIYHHACAANDDCTSDGNRGHKWVARRNYPYECNKKSDRENCDLFFWIDQEKHMRITWYTKAEFYLEASDVSLAHRDYVKRILEPESSLWHTEDGQPAFYAQSLSSLGTGKHTVVLSIPSYWSEHPASSKDSPQNWVAAIETEFKFLKSVAIPGDTGFAVIEDKGGKVLFHSDDKRSLWENLFEETDNNVRLKAHAFSRTSGRFEGRYWGKGHSFYSTPLPGVPWSLVVFRNKDLFRTTNFEALLLAGTLFALYAGISSIVPTAIWLFNKARRRKMPISWFWPDSDRPYWHYICISLILFAFFLVGLPLFGCDVFPDGYSVWFVFSYPLVSLLVLCFLRSFWPDSVRPSRCWISIALVFVLFFSGSLLLFWRGGLEDYAPWIVLLNPIGISIFLCYLTKVSPRCSGKISSDHGPEGSHRRYACMIISFLLLFSALPMGIFFKTGTDREMTLAMKYNLITLGQKLRQTPELDFSQIQREIRGIDKWNLIAECLENGYWGTCTLLKHSIHLSPIMKTMLYISDKEPGTNSYSRLEPSFLGKMCVRTDPGADDCNHTEPSSPLEKLHKFIRANSLSRLSNPVSISTLGLIDDQAPGNPFHWRYDSPTSVSLDFQVPLKQSDSQNKWVILRSSLPSDVWSLCVFLVERPFLGAIVLLAGALVVVLIPIFIVSRIFPIPQNSPPNENSNQAKRNLLIIGLSESLDSYRQKNLPPDQWEGIDCLQIGDPLWWELKKNVLSIQKDGVVLQHFEYQFGVPTFDRPKLSLLADLLAEGKQICVLSTIDPLKFAYDDPVTPSSDESKRPAPVSLQTWSQVFQSFSLQYAQRTPPDSKSAGPKPNAAPHYEAIWQARTIDEKITLHRLAKDGFVHTKNPDLSALFDLGLIKSKPDPHWLDKNFEEYVRNAAQRDGLDAIERMESRRHGPWHVWKWPIAIVLVVLVLGLLSTQQEFHNAVAIVLSLLPVLLPTLSGLIEGSQRDGKAT